MDNKQWGHKTKLRQMIHFTVTKGNVNVWEGSCGINCLCKAIKANHLINADSNESFSKYFWYLVDNLREKEPRQNAPLRIIYSSLYDR